jgi:hypothetical protein
MRRAGTILLEYEQFLIFSSIYADVDEQHDRYIILI